MSRPFDLARSRAILIGTGEYADPAFPDLRPAVANSVEAMRGILADPHLCGWPEDRIERMVDRSDRTRVAGRVIDLADATEEVLLVYFVGHGTVLPDGSLGLALKDTVKAKAALTGLEYRWVREAFLGSRARMKIAILDCCFAGRAIPSDALGEGIETAGTAGTYTLAASDHAAHVPSDLKKGDKRTTSFTGALTSLVRAGLPDGPDVLTLDALFPHLRHRLEAAGLPVPNQWNTDLGGSFPFTRNAAAGPGAAVNAPQPAPSLPGRRGVLALGTALLAGGGPAVYVGHRLLAPGHPPVRPPSVLAGHTAAVSSVAFSPDGSILASGSSDRTVRLWKAATGAADRTLTGHASAVNAIAFSPDGGTLAGGGSDRTVRLWSVATGGAQTTLTGHTGAVNAVAFSPDGGRLASGGADRTTHLWSVVSGQSLAALGDQPAAVNAELFTDGNVLLTAFANGKVRFWNMLDDQKMGLLSIRDVTSANALAMTASGVIAVGAGPGDVALWNGDKQRDLSPLITDAAVNAVAFHPDGTTLAVGMSDAVIQLWNITAPYRIGKPIAGHKGAVTSLAFSPDGRTLASGSVDRTVRLWRNLLPAPATSAPGTGR